jgi:DNA-binding transcriptional LysR family regulator
VALLDAGKVDVAIGVAPTVQESRIRSREIFRDEFVTLVRKDDPSTRKKMDLDAYLALRHILVSPEGSKYGVVDQILADRGLKRTVQMTLPHMFAVPPILRQTRLAAILLRRVALHSAQAGELMIFPPPVPLPEVSFHLIWHRRNESSPSQRWLRETIERLGAAFTSSP